MSDGGTTGGLPPGWAWATLGELAVSVRNGISTKPDAESGISILRISAVRPRSLDLEDVRYLAKDTDHTDYRLQAGDLLFTRYNGNAELVGACACVISLPPRPLVYPDKLIRLRLSRQVAEPKCVEALCAVGATRTHIRQSAKSAAGQVGISGADLKAAPIPIPPLTEQRRIVAKLDELLSRSRAAREALDAVPAMLEQYRKSVLAAAFRGELTEEWQNRSNSNDTSESAGTQDHLPSSWQHTSIGELSAEVPNALTIGPFGSDLKTKDYQDSGVPLVFVRDIRARSFGTLTPKFISTDKARQLARHTVRPGDLLVTKMGDPPGDTAIYPPTRPPGIITADCIKLTPSDRTTSEFLLHWLRAPAICALLSEETQGVAQQKLSLERFRSVAIPLPPRDEQDEIVRRVEAALARIERVKSAVAAQRAQLDALDRAILDKAFRGELVPQDPNDEPAAVMLERLRAEREASETTAPKKKGTRKGGKAG